MIHVFARRIVGCKVSSSARTDVVLDALEQALHARRGDGDGALTRHSDRGVQYVSIRYTERLAEAGIEPLRRSVAPVTATTTHWLRRSTSCTKQRSSTDSPGANARRWNWPRSTGLTGSITNDCWSRSGTSRQRRPKRPTLGNWTVQLRPGSNPPASGKPGRFRATHQQW